MRHLIAAAVALACGGEAQAQLATCDPTDRAGTWVNTLDKTSGDCTELTPTQPSITTVAGPTYLPADCVLDEPDAWSAGNCTVRRRYTCSLHESFSASYDATMTQTDTNGARFEGTVAVTMSDGNGPYCSSSYGWLRVRQ